VLCRYARGILVRVSPAASGSLTLLHFILQVRVVSRVLLLLSVPLHLAISSNYKYTASLCPTSRIVSKTCYLVLCCYAREAWYISHLLLLALHVFNFPPSLCLVQSSSIHTFTPLRCTPLHPASLLVRHLASPPVHQFTTRSNASHKTPWRLRVALERVRVFFLRAYS
jgi:hypothetical protein